MSDTTKSTNVDNGGKNEDLENMMDENFGVCCIGFQKGPEMVIFPTEPTTEPDYVFQALIDELRQKNPNENGNEVTIQAVVPSLRKEYEAVKAKLKARQSAQEKALSDKLEKEELATSEAEK